MDVLCVGQLAADVLVRPVERVDYGVDTLRVDGIEVRSGGDCLNVALSLAKLGISVAFSGKVGTDMLGDYLVRVIAEGGIDGRGLRRCPEAGTCACLVLINGKGDRSFFYHGGTNDLFGPEDVDMSLLDSAALVHIGGTYLLPRFDGPGAASLLATARSLGKITSMDVTWDTTGRWLSVIEPCLPHLSLFMPSIKEAGQMAGMSNPERIADFFQERGVGTAVIKLGDKGCYVKPEEGRGFYTEAFRTEVVDTTGAGDSFVGGFLSGIVRHWPLERCAAFACATAALNIRKVGATGGIPSLEETRKFMEEQGR